MSFTQLLRFHSVSNLISFLICRYRVFLGLNKYFVASDVGNGKMQWYAFHKEPPKSSDPPSGKFLLT